MKKEALSAALALGLALTTLPTTALAAGNVPVTNAKITLSEQYAGAGKTQDWYTEESYRAAPVVTDLDGDGKLEVLNAAYALVVMDAATGEVKWQVNAGKDRSTAYVPLTNNVASGQVFSDFIVEDIDGDGKKEIIIGYGNGQVSVLDYQGYFKPGWPQQPVSNGNSIRSLAVDDLNGDGKKEIIVGAAVAGPVSIWVYHCDGTVASGWPQLDPSQDGSYFQKSSGQFDAMKDKTAWSAGIYGNGITTGDLDGDGLPEIIMPTDTSFINAYKYDGSLVDASAIYNDESGVGRKWGKIALYEDYEQEKKSSSAAGNEGWGSTTLTTRAEKYRAELLGAGTVYTDVDGDGVSEIVVSVLMTDHTTYVTQGNGATRIGDTKYMTVFILNQDRSRYVNEALGFDWSAAPNELTSSITGPLKSNDPTSMSGNVFSVPVCEDLDGDGYQEILFNSYDGMIHCFSLDKTEWSFKLPKTTSTVYEYPTPPVCVDLDGDGTKEVIFSSWTDCEPVNGAAGDTHVNGAVYVLNSKGELLASMDIHNGYCDYEQRNDPTAGRTNGVMGSPVVQDIDGDGKYEILLNTTKYALCAYEITVNSKGVSAFENFTDVKAADYYSGAIRWAVQNNITNGTSPSTFSPGVDCVHVQIVTFLWRALNKPEASEAAPITVDSVYQDAIDWAYSKGLIDSSFNPMAPCTRADVVTYLWGVAGKPEAGTNNFTDVPDTAPYSQAVSWAVSQKITDGTSPTTFAPGDICTRGQVVTFLNRYLQATQ